MLHVIFILCQYSAQYPAQYSVATLSLLCIMSKLPTPSRASSDKSSSHPGFAVRSSATSSSLASRRATVYDRNMNRRAPDLALSTFAFLFSEMVQYSQKNVKGVQEMENRLVNCLFFELSGTVTHHCCLGYLHMAIMLGSECWNWLRSERLKMQSVKLEFSVCYSL